MKKLFTFMAAALFTITAGAANGDVIDGWLMVEDFENSPAISTFSYKGYDPIGTAKVIDNTTGTGTDGKVASFVGGDYNTVIELSVKLPEGKELKNYSQIAFDLYRNSGDGNYKKMLVQADDFRIHMDEGEKNNPEQAPAEKWTEKSYSIDLTNTVGNSFKLRIGILSDNADYLIDNVRLKVINEEDMPGKSQNGTVTNGWLMAEDFEGYLMGAKLTVYPIQFEAKGNADVVKAPTDDRGRSAHFKATDWNNIIEVPIKLLQGTVLSDYSGISFDLYICDGSDRYRDIYIYADDETILAQSGNTDQEKTGEWLTKVFSIPEGLSAGNTFKLRIGMNIAAGEEYYIDNVRLKTTTATGITDVQAGAETVVVVDGGVMINAGAKAAYAVYDISGRAVSQGVADGSKTVTLQRGVYVVRVNGKAVKVLVR
ncbi:MAG TPA: T9SS type A sorting domain-containing protein [Candidatus Prevotella stercoripullorum]|nr:T9SS type A sorting domain-containing protein [Candidatus Prevotella stercoripullorum]